MSYNTQLYTSPPPPPSLHIPLIILHKWYHYMYSGLTLSSQQVGSLLGDSW